MAPSHESLIEKQNVWSGVVAFGNVRLISYIPVLLSLVRGLIPTIGALSAAISLSYLLYLTKSLGCDYGNRKEPYEEEEEEEAEGAVA